LVAGNVIISGSASHRVIPMDRWLQTARGKREDINDAVGLITSRSSTREELMCGIAGWVSFDRDLRSEQAIVDAMTETMKCRGPDDRGTWVAQHAALGHRRLAIIDLPGGAQPMSVDTPNGSVAMVYSGEAYNFSELREELYGRGHRFRARNRPDRGCERDLRTGVLEPADQGAHRRPG
jgi:hypothetical protein